MKTGLPLGFEKQQLVLFGRTVSFREKESFTRLATAPSLDMIWTMLFGARSRQGQCLNSRTGPTIRRPFQLAFSLHVHWKASLAVSVRVALVLLRSLVPGEPAVWEMLAFERPRAFGQEGLLVVVKAASWSRRKSGLADEAEHLKKDYFLLFASEVGFFSGSR